MISDVVLASDVTAKLREVLEKRLPRTMWRAYVEACVALADGLSASANRIARQSGDQVGDAPDHPHSPDRPLGFRP